MMQPLSSTLNNKRKARKRRIPVIVIDDDSDQNANEELSTPPVKRDKIVTTTETIKSETSASNSLKFNGKEELHDFKATEVSNASAIDGDVRLLQNLIQDILKQQSLTGEETSAEHFDAQTVSVAGDINNTSHLLQPKREIIYAPNFEIQVKLNNHRHLVIFVPTNPNLCYYYHTLRKNAFTCFGCEKNYKRKIYAKLLKDKDGKEFIEANVSHLCEPVQYVANNWHIIKARNFFVLEPNRKLIVFNLDYPNFCYYYNYKKSSNTYYCTECVNQQKYISSRVIKDENGEECLQTNKNHICDPFKFTISDGFNILKSPNFTLIHDKSNGSASMLRVYTSIVRSTYYNFSRMGSSYACTGCLSKDIYFMAKVLKSENDEDVVLVWKKRKHVCDPILCF